MDEQKKELKARKKEYKRAKRKAFGLWKALAIISAPLAVILTVITVVVGIFDNSFSIFVGGTFNNIKNKDENAVYFESDFDSKEEMVQYGLELTKQVEGEGAALLMNGTFNNIKNKDENAVYFESDFDSKEEMVQYGLELTKQVEGEGAALLMNENNALPLEEGAKVSCFSNSSVNLVYGGTGSGNIDASTANTLKGSLENTGFEVNKTLWDFYSCFSNSSVNLVYGGTGSGNIDASTANTLKGSLENTGFEVNKTLWDFYLNDMSSSVNLVYGGTGSGNIDASTANTLKGSLENTGFEVNKTLWDFYLNDMSEYQRVTGGMIATEGAKTSEVPWNLYTDKVKLLQRVPRLQKFHGIFIQTK